MPYIAYPFHVKHAGIEYAPGEPIHVDSADRFLAAGAEIVQPPENEKPERPKRRTPKKEVTVDAN